MSDEQNTKAYYDDFSSHYDVGRDRGYHLFLDDLESGLVIQHARGKRVLEIGCGTGLILQRVAEHASRAEGIDLSPGMLALAKRRGLNVREGSAVSLPYPDSSFDVVYSFKVLAHVPAIDVAIREAARVLAPGGVAILEFYNKHSLRFLARMTRGSKKIGSEHRESDIPTRWDTPMDVRRQIAPHLRFERFVGVRVISPLAGLFSLPVLGGLVIQAEKSLSRSKLAAFGGFLVVIASKP